MKKFFLTLSLVVTAMAATAVPAKRGIWKTLTLSDGTEVKATLVGDEHGHFWRAEDGKTYVQQSDADYYVSAELSTIVQKASLRRLRVNSRRAKRLAPRRVSMGEQTHYTGKKKGIVILMQFTDTKFKTANNLAKYNDIMNKEGYSTGNFRGSVADYFKAQSGGIFELEFDVVGPYTAANNSRYYGKNDQQGNDTNAEALIVEAVKAADGSVNYADYDWDGDGEVDQVFVLYAGKGEADGGSEDTIWPHMYYLSESNMSLTLDGVKINTYACSNEVDPSGNIEGIGCFCHEFSHCMGFPDFYDTSYSGWFGMSAFDLMDSGSYNGYGFCPAGYTAYEKWMSGWLEPIELTEDTKVENLKAISDGGESYILYNSGNRNEYYMIENRQKKNWDAEIPGKGLMITHVDFDKTIWEENTPNTQITTSSEYYMYYHYKLNDHQRCTIFHADNQDDNQYWNSYEQYYTRTTLNTDLYPSGGNNKLTSTSSPAATLYNANAAGKKVMEKGITEITQNSNGTVSFVFGATEDVGGDDPVVPPTGDYLFYESFDKCNGTGGNDDLWSGTSTARGTFIADNEGWSANSKSGAKECAKFGSSSWKGTATTPSFTVTGTCTLSFKAAPWGTDGTSLTVSVSKGSLKNSTFTMTAEQWKEFSTELTAEGTVTLTFTPSKRFFLDEVKVVAMTTGIQTVDVTPSKVSGVYTLDGRHVGSDFNALPRGLYIVNGKKVVK